MRIQQIRIRRFRCIEDLTLDIDDYTVLVGPNGSGKSSVLYALDWFFNGGSLSLDDIHSVGDGELNDTAPKLGDIDVEVTFSGLNASDRIALGKYGRGDTARFRKIWPSGDGKPKMIGNSSQGPGFSAIRDATRVTEMRSLYRDLRKQSIDLADVTVKDAILDELARWESDPKNSDRLVNIDDTDATYMFGFTGSNTIAQRIRFVLIPAATDIVGEFGATTGKASAVSHLIGRLMTEAVASARATWEKENATQISSLEQAIRSSIDSATRSQVERVNELFTTLVPRASVDFTTEVPALSLKGDATVLTDVIIDGERRDLSRQGHGVQRAVVISMLQAAVSDAVNPNDDQNGATSDEEELTELPALLVGIEEPEIYQHPVRARHFAKVLSVWSQKSASQVILATHSPYFVLPHQFESLRRFALDGGCAEVAFSTLSDVTSAISSDRQRVERILLKEIPRTFSEAFFSEAVVCVEGDTDRVVLEVIAERLGRPLDANGIVVLAMGGKGSLRIPFALLDLIRVPAYVVADGDAQAARRKHPNNKTKQDEASASHKRATEDLIRWLPVSKTTLLGSTPFSWGDPTTVTSRWCIFHDDFEAELDAWPGFTSALSERSTSLRSKDVAALRLAAMETDISTLPASLQRLVDALYLLR